MLTRAQQATVDGLKSRSSHEVKVLDDGVGEASAVVVHCEFPGIFLTLNINGVIVATETNKQHEAAQRLRDNRYRDNWLDF